MMSEPFLIKNEIFSVLKGLINKHIKPYIVRERKINSETFFSLLLNYCLGNETYSSTVIKHNIEKSLEGFEKNTISTGGFSLSRQRIHYSAFKNIFYDLRDYSMKYEEKYKNINRKSPIILSGDGSDIFLDHGFLNKGYGSNNNKFVGVGKLSIVYNTSYELIHDLIISSNRNERTLLKQQIDILKEGSIIVLDMGYYSKDLLNELNKKNIHVIFRIQKGYFKKITENKNDQFLNLSIDKKSSINVRIVKYKVHSPEKNSYQEYRLLTTLLNKKKYPLKTLKEMYFSRWDIEENIKILKSKIHLNKLVSKTENSINQEVYMSGIVSLITRILELDTVLYLEKKKEKNITINEINKTYKVETSTVINVLKNYYRKFTVSSLEEFLTFYNCILNVLGSLITKKRPNRHFRHEVKGLKK